MGTSIVFRRTLFALSFIAFAVVLFAFLLTVTVYSLWFHHLQRVHHVSWPLLKVLYGIALGIWSKQFAPRCIIVVLGAALLNFAFLLTLRGAWSRREDRLNREARLPSPGLAAAPGVWPPAPSDTRETHPMP